MFELFREGGALGMTLLTLELIAVLLAAWKAPAWVRNLGLLALLTGVLYQLIGLWQAMGVIHNAGGVSSGIMAAGLRVSLIPTMYGIIISAIAIVIDTVQKPRI